MKDAALDLSQVDELVADLGDVAADLLPATRAVIQKGMLNIKTDWQKAWTGHAHAPALGRSVTYDTEVTATGASGEVGPDKDRPQGALGNLFEYGSVNNAPIPGGAPALDAEEPRFVKAMADVAVDSVFGRR